jgi:hypothetical protein
MFFGMGLPDQDRLYGRIPAADTPAVALRVPARGLLP